MFDDVAPLDESVELPVQDEMEVASLNVIKKLFNHVPDQDAWIAGGALRSALCNEAIKDLDIFSNDPERTLSFFNSDSEFKKGFENDLIANFYRKKVCYQVIRKFPFQSMLETINSFDFTIVSAAYGKEGFVYHPRFFMDNAQKRIVINSLPKPLSTVRRMIKYANKGYSVCPVGLATVLRTIQENPINWDNPSENDIEFYPDGTPSFRGLD